MDSKAMTLLKTHIPIINQHTNQHCHHIICYHNLFELCECFFCHCSLMKVAVSCVFDIVL